MKDPYHGHRGFFIPTTDLKMFYSPDNGTTLVTVVLPVIANTMGVPVLKTHPFELTHLLFTGMINCNTDDAGDCRTETYYSIDTGATWILLTTYAKSCQFGLTDKFLAPVTNSIFCSGFELKSGDHGAKNRDQTQVVQLNSTVNFGKDWSILQTGVIGFATFDGKVVVDV
jgi:uncharacterized membrane protein